MFEVIEMLEAAEMNCDNAKKVPQVIDFVKVQIREAIKMLEEMDGE